MEDLNATALLGFSVNITRSDGRVHPAHVKSVDMSKGSVMVEWHEKSGEARGKEIEIRELWTLNRELLEYLKSTISEKTAERKSERRLRSSRIPAPSSVPGKSAVRQTGMFRVPAPVPEPVVAPPQPAFSAPVPRIPDGGVRRSQRKMDHRMTLSLAALPQISEDFKENEEAKLPPPTALSCRKKSVLPLEPSKGNKRVSHVIKPPPDPQNKRGKFGDAKPRKQFSQMIEEFRETLVKVPLSPSDPGEAHRICVCVRKRPLNKQELSRKEIDVVSIPGGGALLVHEPKTKVDLTRFLDNQVFHFDYSFDESSTNELVYRLSAKPLVQTIFEGGMATCFAYGQTGSGKTHTMGGEFMKKSHYGPKGASELSGKSQNSAEGIYGLAAEDVFTMLRQSRYSAMDLSPYVSFFEIYNGKVYDLLNRKALLRVLEDERQQVQVVGLQEVDVSCPDDVIRLIQAGSACRTSGQTSVNPNSSRSHAILQVILRRRNKLHGKFSLVDLAGNERGTDVSSHDKSTLVETSEINRSLLALKECIRSLGQNSDHIPFRMSKLTHVLRDSFIGENSRTCMIAMVSPGMASCDYTLNTLRYADRVKELNGSSKASEADAPKREEEEEEEEEKESMESTSEDLENTLMPAPLPSLYEDISQVAEMAERVHKRALELLGPMGRRWSDIKEGTSEIAEYATTLLEMSRALESTVEEESVV